MHDPTTDQLLTPDDLARRWDMSKGSIANWRSASIGPAYVKLGSGIVRYRLPDVIAFETAGLVSVK